MIAEYVMVARRLELSATGVSGDVATIALESGTPYRHYLAWVKVGATTINVSVQPKFGGVNNGGAVVVNSAAPNKVFQVPIEEIRPPTRSINKHPDDSSQPVILKSELTLTNLAAVPAIASVYMMAMATPGGA